MAETWFYRHDGEVQGPIGAEDIFELARQGALNPRDQIWREGGPPVPANIVFDFSNVLIPETPVPDRQGCRTEAPAETEEPSESQPHLSSLLPVFLHLPG